MLNQNIINEVKHSNRIEYPHKEALVEAVVSDSIAGSATGIKTKTIDSGEYWLISKIKLASTGAFDFLIKDNRSSKSWFSNAEIDRDLFKKNTGAYEIDLPIPIVLKPETKIIIEMTDKSGSPNVCQFLFLGAKLTKNI